MTTSQEIDYTELIRVADTYVGISLDYLETGSLALARKYAGYADSTYRAADMVASGEAA